MNSSHYFAPLTKFSLHAQYLHFIVLCIILYVWIVFRVQQNMYMLMTSFESFYAVLPSARKTIKCKEDAEELFLWFNIKNRNLLTSSISFIGQLACQ